MSHRSLKEDYEKLVAAAEECENNNDWEGAKFKRMLANEICDKMGEMTMEELDMELEAQEKEAGGPAPAPAKKVDPVAVAAEAQSILPVPVPGLQMLDPALQAKLAMVHAKLLIPTVYGPSVKLQLSPFCKMPMLGALMAMHGRVEMAMDMMPMGVVQKLAEGAGSGTQQAAEAYEKDRKNERLRMDPTVQEFGLKVELTEGQTWKLNEALAKRIDTFEEDLAALDEILAGAKNPWLLAKECIRWMEEGVFNGTEPPNKDVARAMKNYGLDAPAAFKFNVLLDEKGEEVGADIYKKICSHLERSSRPSSVVMALCKDLREGKKLEENTKPPAPGSYLHKQERAKIDAEKARREEQRREQKQRYSDRSRTRSPSRGNRRGGDRRGDHDQGDRGRGHERGDRGREDRGREDRRRRSRSARRSDEW